MITSSEVGLVDAKITRTETQPTSTEDAVSSPTRHASLARARRTRSPHHPFVISPISDEIRYTPLPAGDPDKNRYRGGFSHADVLIDQATGELVVAKHLRPQPDKKSQDEQLGKDRYKSFPLREALIHEKIGPHPNILAQRVATGQPQSNNTEQNIYLISKLVDGETSHDWAQNKKPSLKQVASVISQIGEGLQYMHSKGITHLDIKTDNILIDESDPENPHVYITDLESANKINKPISSKQLFTQHYSPPEQEFIDPDNQLIATPMADVYAYAKTAESLLLRSKAFLHLTDTQQNSLDEIFSQATAEDPQDRQPSIEQLNHQLQSVLAPELASTQ